MKRKTTLILAALLPVQILFNRILAGHPEFVETYYSQGLYPVISKMMRFTLGFLPFSLGDLLYAAFIVMLILWIIRRFKQGFKNAKLWIPDALASLSIIYLCFNLFWGFNYYRLPLHQSLGIDNDYTTEKLLKLTHSLIEKSNELQLQLGQNDSTKIEFNFSKNELFEKTIAGYDHLEKDYPHLAYHGTALKRSLYSLPLTYMGFNGYLNPLTNEAQVNTIILPYKIPTTASHEVGHQLGFAKENEANFIACLVTMNHPDPYFRYSGFTFALSYCLSEVYRREPDTIETLLEELHPGVRKNYQEVEDFWLEHQNPLEPLFQATYNQYLVANNQAEGMKSYSYVVALLVNYFDDTRNAF
ncbi:DUF3810 domain-containing protein [Christiangramia flava]|uniref:Uncharacterized protein n=1 Tax=Christiangramia flava JLT2011 TaxID=1229726 RepID=A0A1L7I8D3_9FLAO|nr:DUF3810 domain-containing protein [Christiangramia flava]APU69365.1 hypothetical protein GRFL_2641 [Christiangramia flava JLT2011]OSS37498.1 hypothetical protein C723_3575 [Christiangramia flava JLT2011]